MMVNRGVDSVEYIHGTEVHAVRIARASGYRVPVEAGCCVEKSNIKESLGQVGCCVGKSDIKKEGCSAAEVSGYSNLGQKGHIYYYPIRRGFVCVPCR
jgi:hypothetical protein